MTAANPRLPRWAEVHRLAVAGGETVIARDTGDRLGWVLLARSRYAEVDNLTTATLTLGPHARAFYQRGWSRRSNGRPRPALEDYQHAIDLYRQAGDRAGEAATLANIGHLYGGRGDRAQALAYFEQALPLMREVGDRAGEAATLANIGHLYDGLGDRAQAWPTSSRPCP
ncbi:tetratricopeptide repeat protein [Actinoplanes sp. NPDC051343]|uniref:tetratricopeptide repeat protein n=1 Tax=Actinoplanes sp. NPDC051343 TaxID=3363906 RepID=UPI00378CD4E1